MFIDVLEEGHVTELDEVASEVVNHEKSKESAHSALLAGSRVTTPVTGIYNIDKAKKGFLLVKIQTVEVGPRTRPDIIQEVGV